METGERYRSYLATGCGMDERTLAVSDDAAVITVASRWMGSEPFAARMVCRREGPRGPVGSLRVERFAEVDRDGAAHERELPELPFPPVLEYVMADGRRARRTRPGHGHLAELRAYGYAAWNDAWRLLLRVHPRFEYPAPADDEALSPAAAAFARALRMLDKARFARVAP